MRGKIVSGEEKWGFEIPRVVLGRGATADIKVADTAASRHHAELWINSNLQYMLVDCGSRNGTFLNDQLVCGPSLLREGDVIRIGEQNFEFNGNRSPQAQVPTSMIKIPNAQAVPKFPLVMLALRLVEDEGCLSGEALVRSCAIGQWFAKQQEIILHYDGSINHLERRMIFAYWQAEEGHFSQVLERVCACAKYCLAATAALDAEMKMAVDEMPPTPLVSVVAALHLGKSEGIKAGSEGAEFYVMGGVEVGTCMDMTQKADASVDSLVCGEALTQLIPDLPKEPLAVSVVGPRKQSMLLYRVRL